MNQRFYQFFMRAASKAVFVLFLLVVGAAFVTIAMSYWQIKGMYAESPLDAAMYWPMAVSIVIRSFAEAIGFAALLFLGAALLHRADNFLEAAE